MNTYRVWMRDGYAGLYNAQSIDEAKAQAVAEAMKSTKGVALSPAEQRKALAVSHVDCLHEEGQG